VSRTSPVDSDFCQYAPQQSHTATSQPTVSAHRRSGGRGRRDIPRPRADPGHDPPRPPPDRDRAPGGARRHAPSAPPLTPPRARRAARAGAIPGPRQRSIRTNRSVHAARRSHVLHTRHLGRASGRDGTEVESLHWRNRVIPVAGLTAARRVSASRPHRRSASGPVTSWIGTRWWPTTGGAPARRLGWSLPEAAGDACNCQLAGVALVVGECVSRWVVIGPRRGRASSRRAGSPGAGPASAR
jgi:hypothetical protein